MAKYGNFVTKECVKLNSAEKQSFIYLLNKGMDKYSFFKKNNFKVVETKDKEGDKSFPYSPISFEIKVECDTLTGRNRNRERIWCKGFTLNCYHVKGYLEVKEGDNKTKDITTCPYQYQINIDVNGTVIPYRGRNIYKIGIYHGMDYDTVIDELSIDEMLRNFIQEVKLF